MILPARFGTRAQESAPAESETPHFYNIPDLFPPRKFRGSDGLQVVMVAERFAPHDRRLDLPMARADAVKAAQALGDEGRQAALEF